MPWRPSPRACWCRAACGRRAETMPAARQDNPTGRKRPMPLQRPDRRWFLLAAAAAPLLGLAVGRRAGAQARTIVVGGKNFTEQLIMAAMTTALLRAHGMQVDTRAGMGSTVLRSAQENGQVHLYWEYTGTSLITYNH